MADPADDSAAASGDQSHLSQVARKHWFDKAPAKRVQSSVVKADLFDYLQNEKFDSALVHELESLQCLELYLWPAWTEDSSHYHAILLALLLNAKRRESLPSWRLVTDRPAEFTSLFRRLRQLALDPEFSYFVRAQIWAGLVNVFQSLDVGLVRKECAPLVTVGMWDNLHSEAAREKLLEDNVQFKKAWKSAKKRFDAADQETKAGLRADRDWLFSSVVGFLGVLYTGDPDDTDALMYVERFMEFLTDIQSQFPTRRYANTLIRDLNLLVAVKLSPFYLAEDAGTLRDFWSLLLHYTTFPIDDHSGRQLSRDDVTDAHAALIARLQRTATKNFREQLNLLVLSNYGALCKRDELLTHFSSIDDETLAELTNLLGLRVSYPKETGLQVDRNFILELLAFTYERHPTLDSTIKSMPLCPTERSLYDPALLRTESYDGLRPTAVPKLNLQYLSTGDLLWRSFFLSRCDAFYDIRTFLEETTKLIESSRSNQKQSSRMAMHIDKPAIVGVNAPNVGEDFPAEVKAEIILDVSKTPDDVRREWDELRPGDVVFLLALRTKRLNPRSALTNGHSETVEAPYDALRTAVVENVQDENRKPLRRDADPYGRRPRLRRLIVKLDGAIYAQDLSARSKSQQKVYESINLVVRRKARENTFKPVLESIRALALSDAPLPAWLQDVFLGMGDPNGAAYSNLANALASLDFGDTFVDWQHVKEVFATKHVQAETDESDLRSPPYVVEFPESAAGSADQPAGSKKRRQNEAGASSGSRGSKSAQDPQENGKAKGSKKRRHDDLESESTAEVVKISTYKTPNMGPYLNSQPLLNSIRFTPTQVEAIKSGTQPGLTLIVGPPGTGKTDVTTQIVNNLYHNFPKERILLVAHSNQALNQLFEKISALNIDQRHLLRLGQGERDLQLDGDASYSKYGRVEHLLERGSVLLYEVGRLAQSIHAPGAHGSSCETAYYFNTVYIQPMWKAYLDVAAASEEASEIIDKFPFHVYFANAPSQLFSDGMSREQALEVVQGCYRHLEKLFVELEDIRPFDVLRRERERANFLLLHEARIVAMTSTHAMMRRQEIVKLGFEYDSLVMEEAAQVPEVENFVPMSLQHSPANPADSRLKRVVLSGDHLQNSPIIQNHALRQYANLEQSLFLRLIRLGVPHIQLDAQGRARASLASLFSFRYPGLRNLPHVQALPQFQTANPGLRWDFQFIDVQDYKGKGEAQPTPHFILNVGEAEYIVAMYMYMRLLGYPARSISILTMYAGQRSLVRDVLKHRCANNPMFGLPRAVATVDKYQGEQNDYVLLSLVRTRSAGYMRDTRRLTVALSRARLGLYIFGRRSVFESNSDLAAAFKEPLARPDKLQLVVGEMFPTQRGVEDDVPATDMEGVEHLGKYVYEMTNAKMQAIKAGEGKMPEAEQGPDLDDGEDQLVEDEVHGEDEFDEEEA